MLRLTYVESKEEAVEKIIKKIRNYYQASTWERLALGVIAISDKELETIRKHLYQALEQNLISINALNLLHFSTIKALFNNIYGMQGLSENLFTLAEANAAQQNIFIEFMTEKGITFLRNIKGQISLTHLAKIKDPNFRSAAIDIGYLDRTDVTVQRLCNNIKSFYGNKITDDELSNLRHNIYYALEEKIVPLADLQDLSSPTVRDVFGNKYGDKIFMALQLDLFTLPEINCMNSYTFDELMTDKGIALLKNLKANQIPLSDFVSYLKPHEVTSAIELGHADKAVIELNKRESEERAARHHSTSHSDYNVFRMRP